MAVLGGSPLGLVGVLSTPTRDGISTFNGGRTRNVNVNLYNGGKETDKDKLRKANSGRKAGMFSLFTGGNLVKAWPNAGKVGADDTTMGIDDNYGGVTRTTLHNNDVYDTSVLNIVEKTAGTKAALRPSDFAYLKYLGVYPNNRLMIARRFPSAINDNIFVKGGGPMSILITWRKPDEDFFDISFGEEWEDAKADFTQVLNNIGTDVLKLSPLGGVAGAAFGGVPLPGFTEQLNRFVLEKIGIYESGASSELLPAGNPNLIKAAKRRKTVDPGVAGSGLTCTVSVKFVCEYEQKFISGIDPTIVYMDILGNAARFGTSHHDSYGLSGKFGKKIKGWVDNPKSILDDILRGVKEGLAQAKLEMSKIIAKQYDDQIAEAKTKESDAEAVPEGEEETESQRLEKEKKKEVENTDKMLKPVDVIINKLGSSVAATVRKYREEIYGIVNALSLSPSTPYHVTIGNPLRPVFCSGDMYTSTVNLTLGKTLAFNDLPSDIKMEFTLQNARPWGLAEIMAKFNTGHLRTINATKDFRSTSPQEDVQSSGYQYTVGSQSGISPNTSNSGDQNAPNQGNTGGGNVNNLTTKENTNQNLINSDPNSSLGAVQEKPKNFDAITVGQLTYTDNPDGGVTVNGMFLINNDKEISGTGKSPSSNTGSKEVQKQAAAELAKADAIKKYK
jgi:hypothetical protein